VFCDGFLHVLKIDAEALAFDDKFLELLFEKICSFGFGGRRTLGDNGDRAGANLEEASVGKTGDYFVGGVGIDFELFAEGADGRKFVARTPALAASRKSCSVCWRPRKNRIVGSWRTGKQSTQRLGAASSNSTAAKESRKINWMLTWRI